MVQPMSPSVVKWAIKDKCKSLEREKQSQLSDLAKYYKDPTKLRTQRASMRRTYNRFIKEEREYYSTVKVRKTHEGYTLCYGGAKPSEGTGPFDTVDEAVAWFLSEGV
jgi:hypothetical protein